MSPEQPNTPSENVGTTDATAAAPGSDQPSEESPSQSPRWWQRMFQRRAPGETEADAEGGDQADSDGTSSRLTLTQEELDRRIQAETDRRESKRARDAQAAERKRLRDEDPWAYAQQERQAEQLQEADGQLVNFFSQVGTQHDRVSIDPLVEILPPQERDRIMKLEGAGRGLDGRKLVVTEAIKALQKHWKAEGEREAADKLRRNPAFRKQVLTEARGGYVEPDLLPALSSSAADKSVSEILRTHYHLPTPSQHNNLTERR